MTGFDINTDSDLVEIPPTINGVLITTARGVNRMVKYRVMEALYNVIDRHISPQHEIDEIYISSANDSHNMPSRHSQGKAVDISRLNGEKMSEHTQDMHFQAGVAILQKRFEEYRYRRENFGPQMKLKLGEDYTSKIRGHHDHIHWSVN